MKSNRGWAVRKRTGSDRSSALIRQSKPVRYCKGDPRLQRRFFEAETHHLWEAKRCPARTAIFFRSRLACCDRRWRYSKFKFANFFIRGPVSGIHTAPDTATEARVWPFADCTAVKAARSPPMRSVNHRRHSSSRATAKKKGAAENSRANMAGYGAMLPCMLPTGGMRCPFPPYSYLLSSAR